MDFPFVQKKKKSKAGLMFAVGAGVGAVAGAVAGILTAPKSGKETRKDLERKGKKAIRDLKKGGDRLAKNASEDVEIMTTAAKSTHAAKAVKKATKKPVAKSTKKPAKK